MGDTNTYQSQASELSQQLWGIANELRGNMDASEFKNYILGVIFYRYLSERTEMYMNELLENDGITYEEAFTDEDFRPVVEEWSLSKLGYVMKPKIFSESLSERLINLKMMPTNSVLRTLKKQSVTWSALQWVMSPIKRLMACLMI